MRRSVVLVGFTGLVCFGALLLHAQQPDLPKELTLPQAEELLLRKNLIVLAGQQQAEVAAAMRRVAALKPNPTLQFGAEQFAVASPVPNRVSRPWATNPDAGANPVTTIQYSRTIERGGKRELRTQQAGSMLDAAKAQAVDAFRQQLLLLRQAFTSALLARENLRWASDADTKYAETERLMEARFRSGDVAGVDLERVRLAHLPFQQAVLDARSAYAQAARDIANLLGSTPPLDVAGSLDEPPSAGDLHEMRAEALRNRPDLLAARHFATASQHGLLLAQAARTRDLTTALEYQRVGADNSVGVVVSFPLFVYNNQQAAIDQAVAQQRLSATQSRLLELQVLTDVDKAFQAADAARNTLQLYSGEALQRATHIRDIVNYSFLRGEAGLLDLLDAQRSATQVFQGYNQARAAYLNALWSLDSAVGRTR